MPGAEGVAHAAHAERHDEAAVARSGRQMDRAGARVAGVHEDVRVLGQRRLDRGDRLGVGDVRPGPPEPAAGQGCREADRGAGAGDAGVTASRPVTARSVSRRSPPNAMPATNGGSGSMQTTAVPARACVQPAARQ